MLKIILIYYIYPDTFYITLDRVSFYVEILIQIYTFRKNINFRFNTNSYLKCIISLEKRIKTYLFIEIIYSRTDRI